MEFQIEKKQLLPIKLFLNQFRKNDGIRIPKEALPKLSELFKQQTCISVNLTTPLLSPMELLSMALNLVNNNRNERADILGISSNTLKYHESQVKLKLQVHSKLLALCKSVNLKIIEIH